MTLGLPFQPPLSCPRPLRSVRREILRIGAKRASGEPSASTALAGIRAFPCARQQLAEAIANEAPATADNEDSERRAKDSYCRDSMGSFTLIAPRRSPTAYPVA
jgi:hypothetical protein